MKDIGICENMEKDRLDVTVGSALDLLAEIFHSQN